MKLLIVDDEIQIRNGLQEGLPWDEIGFEEVYTAQNGIEALEICNQYKPEVVITDIQLPGMSGLTLGKNIKSSYEPVEVILLSGYSEFEYAKEAIAIGVFRYLLKPIRVSELIECVKGALEKIEEYEKENLVKDKYYALNRTRILQQMLMSNLLLNNEDEQIFHEQFRNKMSKEIAVGVFSVDVLLDKKLDRFGRLLEANLH
ncbi:MAG: response regulator [Lachnospiraceae bacterium]|nr:response regulator [Lachnospiraceae bacterium]